MKYIILIYFKIKIYFKKTTIIIIINTILILYLHYLVFSGEFISRQIISTQKQNLFLFPSNAFYRPISNPRLRIIYGMLVGGPFFTVKS